MHRDLRGAQIITVDVNTITVRVHLEHHIIGDRTIARSLYPAGVVGDACVVRVTGTSPNYTITEVQSARHAASPGSDQAVSVARGEFHPGSVPLDPGESPYWN